jgi:ribosome-binding protein aMBF1 (putative translation factor)
LLRIADITRERWAGVTRSINGFWQLGDTAPMPAPARDRFHRDVGERIRRTREERGMSQEQLAQRSNLDRSYVSQIENGHKSMSLRSLAAIAGALAVEPHELLTPTARRGTS